MHELNSSVSNLHPNLGSGNVRIQMIQHPPAWQLHRHFVPIITSNFHIEFWVLFTFRLSVSLLLRFVIGVDQRGCV